MISVKVEQALSINLYEAQKTYQWHTKKGGLRYYENYNWMGVAGAEPLIEEGSPHIEKPLGARDGG